jgi:hypothetical protein
MISLKKLTWADKAEIIDFTNQFLPYSDFNFTSLWSYNIADDTQFYLDSNIFIIQMADYITNRPIYSFLGKKNTMEYLSEMKTIFANTPEGIHFQYVPEISIGPELQKDTKIVIEEDRDNFDYILSIKNIIAHEGGKYEHMRWRINQFTKYYPNWCSNKTDLQNEEEKEQLKLIFNIWAETKIERNTEHEKIALERLLESGHELPIHCISLEIEGAIIGFSIMEKVNKYAIGHFMKANPAYKGVFDMLYLESAKFAGRKQK